MSTATVAVPCRKRKRALPAARPIRNQALWLFTPAEITSYLCSRNLPSALLEMPWLIRKVSIRHRRRRESPLTGAVTLSFVTERLEFDPEVNALRVYVSVFDVPEHDVRGRTAA